MSSAKVSVVLIGLLILIVARADAGILVSVDTNTPSIPANGKSYAQILITALEQTGASVPDGTEVRLATSAGDITPAVYTTGGRAVGILTSSTLPQVATITAIVNGASGSVQVEYIVSLSDEEITAGARRIRMTGGSLAYSVDQDTVIGSNNVTMDYKGLTIQAASIQVNQTTGQIRAQGDVNVSKGKKSLAVDELAFDINSERILILNSSNRTDIKAYDTSKLEPTAIDSQKDKISAFTPLLNATGNTWIVSKRLVLIPTQRILFYKATIFVGDSKVMSVPYYSYSYKDRESILQQVRYTSNDGMLVDLPFYYRMSESSASAVKLRYAGNGSETGGYATPRKGPSIGLEQDYLMGDTGRGTLFVDSVGGSSQAYELAHHLEFGSAMDNGRADISARYQPSSSYAKNLYNTSLNLSGSMTDYNYSVYGYFGGSSIKQSTEPDGYLNQSNCSIRTMFRPKKAVASSLLGNISPSLTLGYGTPGGALSSCVYQTLGISSSFNRRLSNSLSSGLDNSIGYTMTAEGITGAEMRMRPSLRTNWIGGNASINYTLNLKSGLNNNYYTQGMHQIGSSLFFDLCNKLHCSSSVDFGLDSKRMNLYSTLQYRATKLWQVKSSYNLYKYSYTINSRSYSYKTSYLQVGIYRPIGMYEVGLAWSPDGQNYGINQDKHIWLEFNGIGF